MQRVFVDVTTVYVLGSKGSGGILRVVRKYIEALEAEEDLEIVCFAQIGTSFYRVESRLLSSGPPVVQLCRAVKRRLGIGNYFGLSFYDLGLGVFFLLSLARIVLAGAAGRARRVGGFEKGDIVLLLDVPRRESFARRLAGHNHGATVVAMIYDLFPVQHPEMFQALSRDLFLRGLEAQIRASDRVVCASRATSERVVDYLQQRSIARHVTHVYLGCDFDGGAADDAGTGGTTDEAPTILSVGTLNPRKNYGYALDLCDHLWSRGYRFRYVIVGACEPTGLALMSRIRSHPQYEKQLVHLGNVGDHELAALYRDASCLLTVSIDEGFCLPLMEAYRHGLPNICSDIPVFRELHGDSARFIPLGNVGAAAAQLGEVLRGPARQKPSAVPPGLKTWRESAGILLAAAKQAR